MLKEIFSLLTEDALERLEKYVYDGFGGLYTQDIEELLADYPNEKRVLAYRGLFFKSKEKFVKFIKSVKNNKLEIDRYSSWSRSKATGEQFALTKPTNNILFLGREFFKQETERKKSNDYTQGYGVILKTVIDRGEAIDVSRTEKAQEDELILPAGKYTVKIAQVFKPHRDTSKEIDINQYIQSQRGLKNKNDKDLEFSLLQHILADYKDEITEASKEHLYNLFGARFDKAEFYIDPKNDYSKWSRIRQSIPNADIYYIHVKNASPNTFYYLPLFPEQRQIEIKQMLDDKILDLIDEMIQKRENNPDRNIFYAFNYHLIWNLLSPGVKSLFNKEINSEVGRNYRKLNSRKTIDAINNSANREEFNKNLNKYIEELELTFNNMN